MSRFEREPNGDRYYDRADPDFHETRKPRGCWCGLDGYPGACPGADRCPYSGYHDKDEEEESEMSLPPSERAGTLRAYAEIIADSGVDLADYADCALELVSKGVRGADIGDDHPETISIAKQIRNPRNQITDIAATVALFGVGIALVFMGGILDSLVANPIV